MKVLPCPDCGQKIRPCNHARHRRAKHLPKRKGAKFGEQFITPPSPIRMGKNRDRRYDEIAPRGEGPHRYRIYRLRAGDLQLIATAENPGHLGLALVTLHADGEFDQADDSVGVLDTATDPGHWIVNPFALGRRAEE